VPFLVSASHWATQVVPAVGFGEYRMIEVQLPSPASPFPASAIWHFDNARIDYDQGKYRECIEKCRYVRHDIEQHLGATTKQSVGTVVAQQLGLPANGPQEKLANNLWKAFAEITNAGHHLAPTERLTRADAHACLMLAALLVEYLEHVR